MIEQLKEYIEKSGLTQKEASVVLGVNRWTLNRWLKGHNPISPMAQKILEKKLKKNN